jgi:hypothetical protein
VRGKFPPRFGRNEPRAAVVKVEAQRVRARLDGNQRVRGLVMPQILTSVLIYDLRLMIDDFSARTRTTDKS